jgi:solute carrier family 25 citrate transporter 1
MIHDQNRAQPKYRGLIHGMFLEIHTIFNKLTTYTIMSGIGTIIKEEGFLAIYRGLFPVIARQGANQAVRFTVYSLLKQWLQASQPAGKQIHWAKTFGIGMIAGTVTVYTTMPLDVLKTKMQGIGAKERYGNSFRCVLTVLREEGLFAFWKGATPRLSRLVVSKR